MTFLDYQTEVDNMPFYDDAALGLAGEVGEVLEIIKKDRRTNEKRKPVDLEHLTEELGDILWYLAKNASVYGISLNDIATKNIDKLKKRHSNG